ncbi:OprD family porin [Azotobacter chroococcum]|uniref:OprD family porin n=1 Tax=Azotobacter chroococcum TaxID=353 RepID=A0AAP9YLX0_9GAMM|nr:OprD family porin [Azotobacter chroococcum]QQE91384.1 OprD family porin [Azotobacter chroococcum]
MKNALGKVILSCFVAGFSSVSLADFLEDSKASLYLRNMYMNRDFRQEGGRPSPREWAQGFTLRFESGFTEGPIGFGLDVMAQLGVKLDSSQEHSGTGLLPVDGRGRPEDEFGELGLTAKLRASKTVVRLGTLQPQLPVIAYNDVRLLSSTYTGGLLTSQEINGLTLNFGRLDEINLRDSSSNDDMNYSGVESKYLELAGGSYSFTPRLTASYYYARMKDIYQQNFFGLVHDLPLGDGVSLRSDLRYFNSKGDGEDRLRSASRVDRGRIDNHFFNGTWTLTVKAHKFGAGYQRLSGDGDFPFPGLDPYSTNLSMYNPFTKAETDAWQLRYEYDFSTLGIPGLTFSNKHVKAHNVKTATVDNAHEWERNTDLAYVIQNGPLKGVNFRLRNASFRASNGLKTQVDETRIIIGYNLSVW